MNTNVCMFIGRLVGDATLTKTTNDVDVGNFTLAVESRRYKDNDGKWKSQKEFLDFEIWDSAASNFAQRIHKGDLVSVRSTARIQEWTDKETQKKRRATRYRVDEFELLARKSDNSERSTTNNEEQPVGAASGSDDSTVPF